MAKEPKAHKPPTDEVAAERERVRQRVTDLVIETEKRIEKLNKLVERLRDEEKGAR